MLCTGLQGELEAANKELNGVKMKLKRQDGDIDSMRSTFTEKEDEFNIKYSEIFFFH